MRYRSRAFAIFLALATPAATTVATSLETAAVYDAGAEFSATHDPNGPWEYGYSSSISLAPADFILSHDVDENGGIAFWHPAGGYHPYLTWPRTRAVTRSSTRPGAGHFARAS